jgi:ER membrane protein complex subunit 4
MIPHLGDLATWYVEESNMLMMGCRPAKTAGTIANPPGYVIVHGGQVQKVGDPTLLLCESVDGTDL